MPPKPEERVIGKQLQDFFPQTELCEMFREFPMTPGEYVMDVSDRNKIKVSESNRRVIQGGLNKNDFCDMLREFTFWPGQYIVKVVAPVNGSGQESTVELISVRKRWIQKEDFKK